ncbi:Putative protein of unknown function [Podospora comata]|uniref:Uncharacterized protein n=1 Tax=Podospora comata TaxID=48703 RepID=A0ABY6SJ35_PODCO|nr:Putative protein of unknown function [Podospora comata]
MAPKRNNNKAPKAPKAPKNHKTTSKVKKLQAPITTRVTRSRARESGEELVSLDITAVTNTTVTTEIKTSTETPRDLESPPRKLARNGRAPKSPSSPKKTPTEKQTIDETPGVSPNWADPERYPTTPHPLNQASTGSSRSRDFHHHHSLPSNVLQRSS